MGGGGEDLREGRREDLRVRTLTSQNQKEAESKHQQLQVEEGARREKAGGREE